jgi:hypothetical protein
MKRGKVTIYPVSYVLPWSRKMWAAGVTHCNTQLLKTQVEKLASLSLFFKLCFNPKYLALNVFPSLTGTVYNKHQMVTTAAPHTGRSTFLDIPRNPGHP